MKTTKITHDNYYSKEVRKAFWSASRVKAYMECEAKALAKDLGEWKDEPSAAMLQGSYLDTFFDGGQEAFELENQVFQKNGKKYAEFQLVDEVYEKICMDEKLFSLFDTGEKQFIMQGEIAGFPFIGMADNIHDMFILDRKFMKDMKGEWIDRQLVPFWKVYRYDIQGAIYKELYKQMTGEDKLFILGVVTKEKSKSGSNMDRELIGISDETLEEAMNDILTSMPIFDAISKGKFEPARCEKCEYCRSTKRIDLGEITWV